MPLIRERVEASQRQRNGGMNNQNQRRANVAEEEKKDVNGSAAVQAQEAEAVVVRDELIDQAASAAE